MRFAVLMIVVLAGCTIDNPVWGGEGTDGSNTSGFGSSGQPTSSTSTGVAVDSMSGGTSTGGASPSTSASGTDDAATSTSSSTGAGDAVGSGGMGVLEPSDLGQACGRGGDCGELHPDAECCEADQCLGTCMVPCAEATECPFEEMGCEHGYCLFPCNDSDDDCVEWPGFTCQHMGAYCENDPM